MKWALHSHEYRVGVCNVKLKWFMQWCTFTSFFILLGKIPAWNTCSLLMEISRKWGWILSHEGSPLLLQYWKMQCRFVLILHYTMCIRIGVYLWCTLTLFVTSHYSQEAGCLSWLKRTPAQYFIQPYWPACYPSFFVSEQPSWAASYQRLTLTCSISTVCNWQTSPQSLQSL